MNLSRWLPFLDLRHRLTCSQKHCNKNNKCSMVDYCVCVISLHSVDLTWKRHLFNLRKCCLQWPIFWGFIQKIWSTADTNCFRSSCSKKKKQPLQTFDDDNSERYAGVDWRSWWPFSVCSLLCCSYCIWLISVCYYLPVRWTHCTPKWKFGYTVKKIYKKES